MSKKTIRVTVDRHKTEQVAPFSFVRKGISLKGLEFLVADDSEIVAAGKQARMMAEEVLKSSG